MQVDGFYIVTNPSPHQSTKFTSMREMRATFTDALHLYVNYSVILGFATLLLGIGLRNFRRRALS